MGLCMCIYIYIYIWVNYNDRTLFSRTLESWFILGESSQNGRTIQTGRALLAGVRPAHGKMGGRTIQVSELL